MSAASSSDRKTVHSLTDLPSDQIVAIADYLPKLSRALFALALTAPPKSFRAMRWKGKPSYLSNAVISSAGSQSWEELNFSKLSNFGKLTDNDIGAILVCINAKNILKKLVFPRHYRHEIVGHGLKPLRRSLVLEEFDFGGWYYCDRDRDPKPSTLVKILVTILESIIDAQENNLRKLSFPNHWRTSEMRNETPLREFYAKFNQFLADKNVPCAMCSVLCSGDVEYFDTDEYRKCQCCCKRICSQCEDTNFDVEAHQTEDRRYFSQSCGHCNTVLCNDCGEHKVCDHCNSVYCSLCAKLDVVDAAVQCENFRCESDTTCMACIDFEDVGLYGCDDCKLRAFPKILAENSELREKLSIDEG